MPCRAEERRKGTAKVSAKPHRGPPPARTAKEKANNTCDHADDDFEGDEQDRHIPEFSRKELIIAIDSLKKGKSADSKGIKADDIKGADEETTTMIHEILNLIIKQNSMAPSSWKNVMITALYKKCDVTNPENCRPICGLPQLYKHFSTMLYNRFHAELDRYQCPDQAGFRKTFQTTDHILTCKLLSQKSREWRTDVWVAASDFFSTRSYPELPLKSFGQ